MTGWEKIVEALKLGRAYAEASVHQTKDLKLMDEALSEARARQAASRMTTNPYRPQAKDAAERAAGRLAAKPLNHDLLERSHAAILLEAQSAIECHSVIDEAGRPILQTIAPCPVAGWIEDYLKLIRDIESEIGRPDTAGATTPEWLHDLIDGRTSLPGKAGA